MKRRKFHYFLTMIAAVGMLGIQPGGTQAANLRAMNLNIAEK